MYENAITDFLLRWFYEIGEFFWIHAYQIPFMVVYFYYLILMCFFYFYVRKGSILTEMGEVQFWFYFCILLFVFLAIPFFIPNNPYYNEYSAELGYLIALLYFFYLKIFIEYTLLAR